MVYLTHSFQGDLDVILKVSIFFYWLVSSEFFYDNVFESI